jgi:2-keto-3-deoxy-L-rhamnonate aldolase RhmA
MVGVMIKEPIIVKNIDSIMVAKGLDFVPFSLSDYSSDISFLILKR